jgi:hypothetical protein
MPSGAHRVLFSQQDARVIRRKVPFGRFLTALLYHLTGWVSKGALMHAVL